jgi:hypothetical protein
MSVNRDHFERRRDFNYDLQPAGRFPGRAGIYWVRRADVGDG